MTYADFKRHLPELVKNYKPSVEALEHIKDVWLLIVIGPSGAGKSTIINHLDMTYVPSDTTRSPRPGEVDGVDMNFLTNYDQVVEDIQKGLFVQLVVGVSGDLYATHASSYPTSGWAVMPVLSDVVPVFRKLGFKKTSSIFIVPPNYDEWMHRMRVHELDEVALQKRLAEAKRSFEFALNDPETYLVLNDDLDQAIAQIKNYLAGNPDSARATTARAAALEQLERIST